MEQRDEKNLGAENLQRIAQQVNGIAEKIVALAPGWCCRCAPSA